VILSAVVSFACLGLRWTVDLHDVSNVQGLDLDHDLAGLPVIVLSVTDGRGCQVHPRYFRQFLEHAGARELFHAGCVSALARGARRLTRPATGDVVAEPELEENAQASLDRYLPRPE
jgi:hypothetical protein